MQQKKPFSPIRSQPQPETRAPPSPPNNPRPLIRFYARFQKPFLIIAGVLMALAAVFLYDMAQPPPQHLTQRDINAAVERALASARPKPSIASQVYETIRPSVVGVRALVLKDGERKGSLGTGVVIDDRGTILTSLHVVKDSVEVRVAFWDGSESEAVVVATEAENDLAVLQAKEIPDDLVPATLASSATLRVGDEVFVVGNPFGITNSLSAGVVSGLGRSFQSLKTGDTLNGLVQFDAAVNPGNSGGPLLNRDGEVVGIVAALMNPTDEEFFVGIGFAVPIETAAAAGGAPPL